MRPKRPQLALVFAGCLLVPAVSSCSTTPRPRSAAPSRPSGAAEDRLSSLARELRELRALPMGTPSHARCPADPNVFEGLDRRAFAALGEPDHVDVSSWTYYLTSPTPKWQFGGGFPELSFVFGPEGRVSRVTCYYAK